MVNSISLICRERRRKQLVETTTVAVVREPAGANLSEDMLMCIDAHGGWFDSA
jgi:hypothetical protein